MFAWLSDLYGFLAAIGCSRMNGFLGNGLKQTVRTANTTTSLFSQIWSSQLGYTHLKYICSNDINQALGLHAASQASKAHACQTKTSSCLSSLEDYKNLVGMLGRA